MRTAKTYPIRFAGETCAEKILAGHAGEGHRARFVAGQTRQVIGDLGDGHPNYDR